MAQKPLQLVNGKITQVEATVVSTGASDAGEVVALDSTGKIDVSVLPLGVGPDVSVITASENIPSYGYVNIWDDGGTPKARLADYTNGRDAHGFVKSAVTSGNPATVYFEGPNENFTGLTIGARYYLASAGSVTSTPPVSPATISQFVGYAISSTTINTDIDDVVVLA